MSKLNSLTQSDLDQAFSLFHMGDVNKAQKLAKKLYQQQPKNAQVLHLIALCAKEQKGLAAGIVWLRAASRCQADANVWYDLGIMLAASNQVIEAFDALSRAAALNPKSIESLLIMASLMRQMGREAEAQPFYQIALNNAPNDFRAHLGMAITHHFLRNTDAAEPLYQSAIALSDSSADVCWEYAMQNLLLGNFKDGWKNYDSRLLKPLSQTSIYPFKHPLWQGESLKGKTLLIHGEQGFGDEIMFASIINELIEQAKHVIIATAPSLYELFKISFPKATVYSLPRGLGQEDSSNKLTEPQWLTKLKSSDFQCPIGSLPRWCRTHATDFTNAKPYLHSSVEKVDVFKGLLSEQNIDQSNLKVGLVWQGNLQTGLMGQRKSISIEAFLPLAIIPNINIASLQLEDVNKQLKSVPKLRVQSFHKEINDFNDTAALIANLDLVITVDTAVAHLAAAMGKETWVLLWRAADWRYGLNQEQCYWYENMHLFHQTNEGQWTGVIEQVRKRLLSKASNHKNDLPH